MQFSIIIPVYNAENTLKRCLDSILNQSYNNYEIILVNDGSKDNSENICLNYSNQYKNVKYVKKENGGASSARNKGIDEANGDYILFVDSDDYVDSNYFDVLKDNCIEDGLAIFTYTWLKASGLEKRNISTDVNAPLFEKVKSLTLNRSINSPYSKIFDRALIEQAHLRFDERMPVAEDFNFCLRYIMMSNQVFVSNQSVYFYDVTNEQSLVHKRKKGLIDIYPIVFDYAFDTINNSPFSDSEKNQLFRVWDKLHTDSFITCVLEEVKDDQMTSAQIKKEIKQMCSKFYNVYKPLYGYENIIHFAIRFCIKHKCTNALYYSSKLYSKVRK
jgi:glycosyltransferase involved in cell wall biosynthesis